MNQQETQIYNRVWYAGRTKEQKLRKITVQRDRRIKIRKAIDAYKSQHVCKCGESDIRCLEFHHTKDDKEISVANAVRIGWGIKRIMLEIAKCIVLCANCHRKLHYSSE